ncbi:hypothetical protein [Pseudoalteromonas sp. R3]|uniref:hypothetical protein n=1 Tax=Pseudoalteromonas sp. R3 TaxID=1709477 RepID=UPI0006B61458|nr:hypothetical protein [Pseudoalteromonas sp. R3]AZZ97853.1 hypothetical protein ELR70_12450 [Pseudoalteromonas sp. R3]
MDLSQLLELITVLLFPIAFVFSSFCFFKSLYFFVKALLNTVEGAFHKTHTSFNFLNVLWVPGCLNERGKLYRRIALRNIIIALAWMLLFLAAAHSVDSAFAAN